MGKFEYWTGYIREIDDHAPKRLRIEEIANEVAELLIKKDLNCRETREVLQAVQDFIDQVKFIAP